MRKLAMTAAGIAAAVVGTGALLMPTASATTDGVLANCPSGAVCLQEPNGTILSKNIWYSYGAHNLSNVTGIKYAINNQTGGAGFTICYDRDGGRCTDPLRATGTYGAYDYTPINSIVLVR
ncbi:hypothetical protein ACFVWG_15395 [Kribbella sp. NPDC058245]|uniref:hypothetical protein n=1 Tax=Kribbella sp. NPDC058245 TaxID=3346399 RepID=UPI0036ED8C3A